ncbi:MAG: hypothetical protein HEQ22_02890 [Sphingopyxis sp.]|uniref:H-X9-DG-CTERM domain-containing protein n=1 Tax=Sphingopyxis sp. TaxID=1908224 RepID=UPI003D80CEE0
MSKPDITPKPLTDSALDSVAGGTKAHPGGVNILLADGSVRGATGAPKDGAIKPITQQGTGNGI